MTKWRKASHSNSTTGDCVEVANLTGNIGVRDSKNPDGPKLIVSADAWDLLADQIKHERV